MRGYETSIFSVPVVPAFRSSNTVFLSPRSLLFSRDRDAGRRDESSPTFLLVDLPCGILLGRYGLAADALIALGGLSAAARDEDGGEARRMLILTKESLNDILTIGVNNNLNRTD